MKYRIALKNVTSPFDKILTQTNREITNNGSPPKVYIIKSKITKKRKNMSHCSRKNN